MITSLAYSLQGRAPPLVDGAHSSLFLFSCFSLTQHTIFLSTLVHFPRKSPLFRAITYHTEPAPSAISFSQARPLTWIAKSPPLLPLIVPFFGFFFPPERIPSLPSRNPPFSHAPFNGYCRPQVTAQITLQPVNPVFAGPFLLTVGFASSFLFLEDGLSCFLLSVPGCQNLTRLFCGFKPTQNFPSSTSLGSRETPAGQDPPEKNTFRFFQHPRPHP